MDPLGDDYRDWDLHDARLNMGYTLKYAKKIDLVNTTTTTNVEYCSTQYCLRNPGIEYLIYQPSLESFNVQIIPNIYTYGWINPATGKIVETGDIRLQEKNQFTAHLTEMQFCT